MNNSQDNIKQETMMEEAIASAELAMPVSQDKNDKNTLCYKCGKDTHAKLEDILISQDKEIKSKDGFSYYSENADVRWETTQDKINWEERLKKEFNWEAVFGKNSTAEKKIKAFISSLLTEKEEEIVRKLEGLDVHTFSGQNSIVHYYKKYEVLDLIKGEK